MKLLFIKFLNAILKLFLLTIAFWGTLLGICYLFSMMVDSGNMALMMIALAGMMLLIFGTAIFMIWLIIREMGKRADTAPHPIRTQLLSYETEGLGRMASAGLGSFFGGGWGMAAGFLAGGKKDFAVFLVTYSNGTEKIEQVKLNSMKYQQYKSLQR